MDSKPVFVGVARALRVHNLEAILIGNAAAALHGAPVTTIDLDFFIRKTPANLKKLKGIAKDLGAVVFKQFYPASDLVSLMRDEDGLKLDFTTQADGLWSFEELRSRSYVIEFDLERLNVAALSDLPMHTSQAIQAESESTVMNERTHFLRRRIGICASII